MPPPELCIKRTEFFRTRPNEKEIDTNKLQHPIILVQFDERYYNGDSFIPGMYY